NKRGNMTSLDEANQGGIVDPEELRQIKEAKVALENIGVTGLSAEDYLAIHQLLPGPPVMRAEPPPKIKFEIWLDRYNGTGEGMQRDATYHAVGTSKQNAILNLLSLLQNLNVFDWGYSLLSMLTEMMDGKSTVTHVESDGSYSYALHLRER
ncbi:MAG: hypothetical protein B7Z37_28880, partial [Verrucomicrobia bacterium 12-59-8]